MPLTKTGVRWVGLPYFQLDCNVISQATGEISVSGGALSVLDVLFQHGGKSFYKKPHARYLGWKEIPVAVSIKQKRLAERTGLSTRSVVKAVKELQENGFIERISGGPLRSGRGRHSNRYLLLHLGMPLFKRGHWHAGTWQRSYGRDKTLLGTNHVRYFTFPSFVATHLLPLMKPSETKLYHALLWTANEHRSAEFEFTVQTLCKTANMTPATLSKALEELNGFGLIQCAGRMISICDPETGAKLNASAVPSLENHRNWRHANTGNRFDPIEVLKRDPVWYLSQLLGDKADIHAGSRNEYRFRCPLHDDEHSSASMNATTGLWKCFAGHERNQGNLWQLIQWTRNLSTPKEAQVHLAEAAGVELKYFEPDSHHNRLIAAGATYYEYFTPTGEFLYRKFRVVSSDGTKRFLCS